MWYNLIMTGDKVLENIRIQNVYISDSTEIGLVSVDEETRKRVGRIWSNPTARMGDNSATYRFVNYLDSIGLLPDHRAKGERGWRKFSYVDIIYLELVIALRKIGVKANAIKLLYHTFSVPFSDEKALYMGIDWLDLLLAVHCGTEIELLISPDNGGVIFCDPPMMILFGTGATDGQIRVSLSKIVNSVREKYNLKPIEIKRHFGQSNLSDGEFETVFAIRNLKNEEEEVRVHKTVNNRVLVDTKKMEKDEAFKKDIEGVMKKYGIADFTNLSLAVRQGGVAYVKKTDSKIFDK
jgi:hypothetical protein